MAAVPAVPGPLDLLFLTHLPLRALEVGGELPLLSYTRCSARKGPRAFSGLGYGVRPSRGVINYTLGQSDAKGAFAPRCQFSFY